MKLFEELSRKEEVEKRLQRNQGESVVFQQKLMLVGEENVGKTTIRNSLTKKLSLFDWRGRFRGLFGESGSTIGIDLEIWKPIENDRDRSYMIWGKKKEKEKRNI